MLLQLFRIIIKNCSAAQLAMLQASCTSFRKCTIIQSIARQRLKAIPRAQGLKPRKR